MLPTLRVCTSTQVTFSVRLSGCAARSKCRRSAKRRSSVCVSAQRQGISHAAGLRSGQIGSTHHTSLTRQTAKWFHRQERSLDENDDVSCLSFLDCGCDLIDARHSEPLHV